MAEKEATVYIVDVGRSMGECHNGRPVTDLDWAMRYVWDRITTTVSCPYLAAAPSLILICHLDCYWSEDGYTGSGCSEDRRCVSYFLPGLSSDARMPDTVNDLEGDPNFANISVLLGLGQALMPDVRKLRESIKPSHTNKGDGM